VRSGFGSYVACWYAGWYIRTSYEATIACAIASATSRSVSGSA
jgi:hypothetical protein